MTENLLEQATIDVSMIIDTENIADKTQLREPIHQKSLNTNEKLYNEIAKLKKFIPKRGVKGNRGLMLNAPPSSTINQTPKKPSSFGTPLKDKSRDQCAPKVGEQDKDF